MREKKRVCESSHFFFFRKTIYITGKYFCMNQYNYERNNLMIYGIQLENTGTILLQNNDGNCVANIEFLSLNFKTLIYTCTCIYVNML